MRRRVSADQPEPVGENGRDNKRHRAIANH